MSPSDTRPVLRPPLAVLPRAGGAFLPSVLRLGADSGPNLVASGAVSLREAGVA